MINGMECRKENCCGCQACVDICPVNAVRMYTDEEGFWYPSTDQAVCTRCGLCKRVCPVKSGIRQKEDALYLGVQAKDDTIRYASSSGGMFPILAHAVLKKHGVVYGAGYDGNMEVQHKRAGTAAQLEEIKRTKYVQSSMKGIYQEIQKELQRGHWVLFCGTPCQAQALRQFLDGEDARLILVDLVCYGVGSPGIWKDYVAYLEHRYEGKLKSFSFRDKRNRNHGQTRSFVTEGREIVDSLYQDAYCRMYFRNYSIRPSCHSCSFCGTRRSSDFTIGDFWGVENIRPDFDDGMGTSLVIVHTEKAKKLWNEIEKDTRWFVCERKDVLQPRLREPTKAAKYRGLFMKLYRRLPFSVLVWIAKGRKQEMLIKKMTAAEHLKLWEWELYKWRKRQQLKNASPVIIASNCVGTIIYHDLNKPFYSPTINLFFYMDDFIRFVENLEWYLEQPLIPVCEDGISYPVGMAGDIKIHFMHYDTFENAAEAWEKRKQRVDLDPDNLFIIGCERGRCTYEILQKFDQLPYKNKVVLTHKNYPEIASAFHIHGFEIQEELGNVLEFRKERFWKRRYIDDFDYVSFLNGIQKPLISVIVPVYQCAKYIDTCVQSVLSQTYSNFELILVDDGSKDGSREICESLGVHEQRIRLLTQKHRGVSAARNTGIKEAVGEYLFFLDSDDAIHPELLEKLCNLSEKSGAVVSVCAYYSILSERFDEKRKRLDRRRKRNSQSSYLKNQEALESFIFEKGAESWSVIWGKLIRRSGAEELWFDETLSNEEDTKYMYQLLERGADAAVLQYRGYYYRKRNGSASRRQNMKAYKSIYKCDCYIRDREMECGRVVNAMQRERDIVSKIAWWYASGHGSYNEALKDYILELEKIERSSRFWNRLGPSIRLQHLLAFRCHPVYEICRILRETWIQFIGL